MCAVAAGIGALSREYGLIFIIMIIPVLISMRIPIRHAVKCLLLAIIISCPFYIRNILIFNNPFYPLSLFGLLPHNQIHQSIMEEYGRQFSLFSNSNYLLDALKFAIIGLPIQLIALFTAWKSRIENKTAFYSYSLAIIAIWAYSTKYTCGGIYYSMRVLTPAIIAVSILSGPFIANFAKTAKIPDKIFKFICIAMLLVSFIFALTLPINPFAMNPKKWFKVAFEERKGIEEMAFKYAEFLPDNSLVLSDSALYQSQLYRKSNRRVQLIPVWTPEMIFLFNDGFTFDEKITILKKSGITHIMRTNESANNDLFERHEFFKKYPQKLREVIRGPDSQVFAID